MKRGNFYCSFTHSLIHSLKYLCLKGGFFSRIIQKLRNTINKKLITCIIIKRNLCKKIFRRKKTWKEKQQRKVFIIILEEESIFLTWEDPTNQFLKVQWKIDKIYKQFRNYKWLYFDLSWVLLKFICWSLTLGTTECDLI